MSFCDMDQRSGSYWPEAHGGWSILSAENEEDLEIVEDEPVGRPYLSRLTFEPRSATPAPGVRPLS